MKILTESQLKRICGGNTANDPKVNTTATDNQFCGLPHITAEDDWESPVA